MKVSDIIEFKSKKIKELNLKKELTEQVCDWILEILHNIDIPRVEFKEEDICIDEVGYFTINIDDYPMGFEVRKLQNDNFIYTIIDLDLNFFKKGSYKYDSIDFATKELLDKIGGK